MTGGTALIPFARRTRARARLVSVAGVLGLLAAAAPVAAAVSAGDSPQGPAGTLPPSAPDPGPSIAGTERDGSTLTGSEGNWGIASTEHVWLRCTSSGTGCAQVSTATSYTLTSADVGKRLKFRVRGTSLSGGTREAEAATSVIDAIPPALANPPTLSGEAVDGGVLTGSAGSGVSGSTPIESSFSWLRCDAAGSGCSPITAPASSPAPLTLTAGEVGGTIRLRQTLQGPQDTVDRDSDPSAQVAPRAPQSTSPPAIAGEPREGSLLTALPGSWSGTPSITFSYVWSRCTAACVRVGSGATYRASAADVGARMRLDVTAANAAGDATRSALSATIAPLPPPPVKPSATRGLPRLSPFPVVTVGGSVTRRGTRISLMQVRRLPRGARVAFSCRGRSCPFRRHVRTARRSSFRVRALERLLRPGTVVTITIRKGSLVGKLTRLRVRAGVAPARIDRCLLPGSSLPIRCS